MGTIADLMAAAVNMQPRGRATIPNPIVPGRQSENVEVVQGWPTMPQDAREEFARAYMEGMDVGPWTGAFDTLTSRSITAPPGELAQWRPNGPPLNPAPGGAAKLAHMGLSPSPGWMPPGPPPDSSRIHPGSTGRWDTTYPVAYGRGEAYRPSFNLLLGKP